MEKELFNEVEQLEKVGCLIEKVEALNSFLLDKLRQVEQADMNEPREALFYLKQDLEKYQMLGYLLEDNLEEINKLNSRVIKSLMQ